MKTRRGPAFGLTVFLFLGIGAYAEETLEERSGTSRETLRKLEERLQREIEDYKRRPRTTFIGARAKELRFSRYVEDWRLKVEASANANYPQELKRLSGSALITVEIWPDGTIEKVQVSRSSGHPAVDHALINIVERAAPFGPFTEEMRRDTELLSITRTFTFAPETWR